MKAKWHLRVLCACVPTLAAPPANAFELSAGVSAGGMLAGAVPRLAVSPHLSVAWGSGAGPRFALQDMASLVFAPDPGGPGIHNLVSAVVGYAWKSGSLSAGPSLSGYHMPACGPKWCAPIYGISPGGRAYAELFLAGPLGVSISANLGWMGGNRVVSEGVSAMVAAGLVLRLQSEVRR